jgi:hypothetical protein
VIKIKTSKYPVQFREIEKFSFLLLKIACFGILAYYILEMLNRVIFFTTDIELDEIAVIWRIIDSAIYAITFIIIAIQTAMWRENLHAYENRKKARNAFFTLLLTAGFTAMYEILILEMDKLPPSHRSDLTVPFLFMIVLHYYSISQVRQIISRIGRTKKTETGRSIFYTLFALNPCIRYLVPFLLMVLTSVGGDLYFVYMFYSDLIMTYLSAAIAVGFTVMIFIDSRKIRRAYLMETMRTEIDKQLTKESLPKDQVF